MNARGVRALLKNRERGRRHEPEEANKVLIISKPFNNEACIFAKPNNVWLQSNLLVLDEGLTIFGKVAIPRRLNPCLVTVTSRCVQISCPRKSKIMRQFCFDAIFCVVHRDMSDDDRKRCSRNAEKFRLEEHASKSIELESNQFAIVTTKAGFHRGLIIILEAERYFIPQAMTNS